ncbi:MAG: serine hydrolase [Gemmatimonadetes bacterium]|nr:serine hydrolase [Gemmatimonadota bacterium]
MALGSLTATRTLFWTRRALRPWLAALTAVALLALACVRPATPPPVAGEARPAAVYPGESWGRIAVPESAGYSRALLDTVLAHVRKLDTTGLVVAVGGRVLLEYGNTSELSYVASVRKSVLAMLYGNYVASGAIRLERTLADLGIDDHGGLLPRELEATVAHLLAARSGIYHPASNAGDDTDDAPPRGSQRAGTYYLYNNWDFNALGTIFEQATGRAIYDALETDLARPIGMQDFRRDVQRKSGDLTRSKHPAYHMWLSTRDMARLGHLMLREGSWAGRQLIPREWARRIARAVTPVHEMHPPRWRSEQPGYGYLWWVFDGVEPGSPYEGGYMAIGAYGQFILVLPKLDMVVAHKTAVPPERRVTRDEFLRLVDDVLGARCVLACRGGMVGPAGPG